MIFNVTSKTSNIISHITDSKKNREKHQIYYEQYYDDFLVKFIINNSLPIHLTENKDFKQFCDRLDSRYQLPSRRTLTYTLIPNHYKQVKEKIRTQLKDCKSINICTDIWSDSSMRSFLAFSVHAINSK